MGILNWNELRYWQKALMISVSVSVLLYMFKLFKMLYRDWTISSLSSGPFVWMYALPSLNEAIMVVAFLGGIFVAIGIVKEVREVNKRGKEFMRETRGVD